MSPDHGLLPSPRLNYHNPVLGCYSPGDDGGPLNKPDEAHPYNLVSSLCEDGLHRPALDVDWPQMAHQSHDVATSVGGALGVDVWSLVVVASATNYHIYAPTLAMGWPTYQGLLEDLVISGHLERRYVDMSKGRSQTLLRPPHVRKVTS